LPHVNDLWLFVVCRVLSVVCCSLSFFTWWNVSVTRCLEGVVHLHGAKHPLPCRPCLHGGTCFPACKIDGTCTKSRCLDSVVFFVLLVVCCSLSFSTWWKVSVTRCLEGVVHLHGAKDASPCRPCLHGGTCFPACKRLVYGCWFLFYMVESVGYSLSLR